MRGLENTNEWLAEFDPPQEITQNPLRTDLGPRLQRSTVIEPSARDQSAVRANSLYFFFFLGCAFAVIPIFNALVHPQVNKDYRLWYAIGRSVIAGEPLYETVDGGEPEYMYPPTAAVLLYAPLSHFGPVVFTTILCLSNAIAWAFVIWATKVLVSGDWRDGLNFTALAPGLAIAAYVWDIQLLGQLNLVLLALTLGAFVMNRNGHPIISGGFFGAAVALKVFPLPAIAYFLVRRQWKAVFASFVSLVVFVWLIPGIVRGFERNTSELKQWARLMIFDQSGQTMAGRSSIGFSRRNQSLVSLSHRLLRPIDAGDHPAKATFVNFADLSPQAAQLTGYALCLFLGLVLLGSCRFRPGSSNQAEGLELAMVCTLVPLCSPLAWTYYFCWLLPAWSAVEFWLSDPSLANEKRRNALLGVGVSALLFASAVSEQFDPTLQALGVTALGAVTLFLTMAYLRFHLSVECALVATLEPGFETDVEPSTVRRHPKPK